MISKFPEVLNFNQLFLELDRFICNSPLVLPGRCLNVLGVSNREVLPLFPDPLIHKHPLQLPSSSYKNIGG